VVVYIDRVSNAQAWRAAADAMNFPVRIF